MLVTQKYEKGVISANNMSTLSTQFIVSLLYTVYNVFCSS